MLGPTSAAMNTTLVIAASRGMTKRCLSCFITRSVVLVTSQLRFSLSNTFLEFEYACELSYEG